jgi:hypothetical protein
VILIGKHYIPSDISAHSNDWTESDVVTFVCWTYHTKPEAGMIEEGFR